MRLRVMMQVERETVLPLNCQHQLSSAVYALLERADPDYARFLHGQGYAPPEDGAEAKGMPRRFKGFTFGPLSARCSRVDTSRRDEPQLVVAPGPIEWQVASPLDQFLHTFASGLLQDGQLRIGAALLAVQSAETLPSPQWQSQEQGEETRRFRCLSPVVASATQSGNVPGQRQARYLRPDDPEWSERLTANLRGKCAALKVPLPDDAHIRVTWDAEYLKRRKGTKLITYKDIRIFGLLCPFEMSGNGAMMQMAYECGLGEKNAGGFGMIEVI